MKMETRWIWVNEECDDWMYDDEFRRHYGPEWIKRSGGLNTTYWKLRKATAHRAAWRIAEAAVICVSQPQSMNTEGEGTLTTYRWSAAQPWLEVDDD